MPEKTFQTVTNADLPSDVVHLLLEKYWISLSCGKDTFQMQGFWLAFASVQSRQSLLLPTLYLDLPELVLRVELL